MFQQSPDRGFTLIEIIIVVAITALISSFAIVYSGMGQRQVSLYIEEQKIAAFIERARSLTVTIFNQSGGGGQPLCGYGFEIDYTNGTYSIFGYKRPAGQPSPTACETINNIALGSIDSSAAAVPQSYVGVHADRNLKLDNTKKPNPLQYVLFIAPDPRTIVADGSANTLGAGTINLLTLDGKSSVTISVNSVGQVDF